MRIRKESCAMSDAGNQILVNACFYLFDQYGGPFGMQKNAGHAVEIMFKLMFSDGLWS